MEVPTPSFTIPGRAIYLNMADMASPAATFWVGEGDGSREIAWNNIGGQPTISTASPRKLGSLVERHLDTLNVFYCDGHVKANKLESLTQKGMGNDYCVFSIENDGC